MAGEPQDRPKAKPRRRIISTRKDFDPDSIELQVINKQSGRKMCTFKMTEEASLEDVGRKVIEEKKELVIEKMGINEEQCRTQLLRFYRSNREVPHNRTLKSLWMSNCSQ